MIGSILGSIRGLFVALGWFKQKSDEATGAALQRGTDAEAENERLRNVIVGRNKPLDDGLLDDKNDRKDRES
jgi:hypothetical protein